MRTSFVYAGARGSNLECAVALHSIAKRLGMDSSLVLSKDNPRAARVSELYPETIVHDFYSIPQTLKLRKRLSDGLSFFTMISPKMVPLFLSLPKNKVLYFHSTYDYSFSARKPSDYAIDLLQEIAIRNSTLTVATQYPLAWQIRLRLGKEADVLPHPPYSPINEKFFADDQKVQLPFGDYLLDFGGVERPSKGTDVLLEAAKGSSANVVIAGKRRPIPEKNNLLHLNRWVSDGELHHLVKNCRAVVLPYLVSSQFSGCLALAFHFKKPVIAPFAPAFEKWIEDGRTGWFFSQGDWHDLAEKMDDAFAKPLHAAEAIAKKEKEMEALTARELGRIAGELAGHQTIKA